MQLNAKKELLQKDIETQAKRIYAFEKRIDDQNSRIGDIGSNVAWFSIFAGIFGTLITLLLALGALVGYKTAKKDAQETAEGAAKETATTAAEEWFKVNHNKLISQMDDLESRVAQANQTIDGHTKEVAQKSSETQVKMKELEEALEEKAQTQMQAIQNQMSQDRTTGQSEDQFPKDNSAIEQKSDQLKQKPESDYTFSDWNTRAFAAISEGKLENAIFYWDNAINAPNIQPQAHAQSLFNKGVTLGQLNRSEEAIAAYDVLITQFSPAEEFALREEVAKALNGKGFRLLCMAKTNWDNPVVANELLAKASDACKLGISKNPDNGIAHGNLAYISWLKGDAVAAEQHFRAGLSSTIHGGEALYKATLTDFDIHPIEPDQGFRALVEKLWAEHQAERAET